MTAFVLVTNKGKDQLKVRLGISNVAFYRKGRCVLLPSCGSTIPEQIICNSRNLAIHL